MLLAVPTWDVLPRGAQRALWLGPQATWTVAPSLILAVNLAYSWARPRRQVDAPRRRLLGPTALPLAVLGLVGAEVGGRLVLPWGAGAVVVLLGLLLAAGLLDQHSGPGGLLAGARSLRVPELLRIDRLGPPDAT